MQKNFAQIRVHKRRSIATAFPLLNEVLLALKMLKNDLATSIFSLLLFWPH